MPLITLLLILLLSCQDDSNSPASQKNPHNPSLDQVDDSHLERIEGEKILEDKEDKALEAEEKQEKEEKTPNDEVSLPPKAPVKSYQGFATENGGTIGAGDGRVVIVTKKEAFLAAIKSKEPLVIKVAATIYLSGMHHVASHKTILGVEDRGVLSGGGLNLSNVTNIIIKNLLFTDSNDDAINIEGSSNILIENNDLREAKDGLIDIKKQSDFITIAWNHFTDHEKTCLLSSSDSDKDDKDHLRVTYHHNFFDGTSGRHPRVRFSKLTHVYNNYYLDNNYGIASTQGANVLVEGNYFENVTDPLRVTQGSSQKGFIEHRDNGYFDGQKSDIVSSFLARPPYEYEIDKADMVPKIVRERAGRKGYASDHLEANGA